MKKLYIIGNGFDLHHGFRTRYEHFKLYLQDNKKDELLSFLMEYFEIEDDDTWKSFEENLGNFDFDLFYDNRNNINADSYNLSWSSSYGLLDELQEDSKYFISELRNEFEAWISEVDISFTGSLLDLSANQLFLTFNYTRTLEDLYNIDPSNILHIHGIVNNGDLIFGHGEKQENVVEIDENGDSLRTIWTDAEDASKTIKTSLYKNVDEMLFENCTFFNRCVVNSIYVFGHSYSLIDSEYFRFIYKSNETAKWFVSFHGENDKDNFEKLASLIGLSNSQYVFINIKDCV